MQEKLKELLNEWKESEIKFAEVPSRIKNAEKLCISKAVETVLAESGNFEILEEEQKIIDEMRKFLASTV